jgi:hypothetical protein
MTRHRRHCDSTLPSRKNIAIAMTMDTASTICSRVRLGVEAVSAHPTWARSDVRDHDGHRIAQDHRSVSSAISVIQAFPRTRTSSRVRLTRCRSTRTSLLSQLHRPRPHRCDRAVLIDYAQQWWHSRRRREQFNVPRDSIRRAGIPSVYTIVCSTALITPPQAVQRQSVTAAGADSTGGSTSTLQRSPTGPDLPTHQRPAANTYDDD